MADPGRFGFRRLKIYQDSHDLAKRIEVMTRDLPRQLDWELGGQVRRSSKSTSTQIVEGYALRKYRDEYLHYLHRSLGSCDETWEHVSYLKETGWLEKAHHGFIAEYEKLSASIACFIIGVERDHSKPFYLRFDAPSVPPPPPPPPSLTPPQIEDRESPSRISGRSSLGSRIAHLSSGASRIVIPQSSGPPSPASRIAGPSSPGSRIENPESLR